MKRSLLVALLVVATAATPNATSPYAGRQNRPIPSLDSATIQALQNGEGHGMALVGELNHYPGPRHVLAMASHLGLTDAQKAVTQRVYDEMHAAAVPLGLQVIEKERQLDQAFRSGSITDDVLQSLTQQIAALNGRLRFIHLRAHLAMKRILTPEQIEMYDSMRGHAGDMPEN
jgi:Spy/CpxP family protein refolding chaperone